MSTWRTGRKVGRTIYALTGPEPSDGDRLIGVMDSAELAADAVAAHNEVLRLQGRVNQLSSVLLARTDDLRAIRERLAEVQARLDARCEYRVTIVPGAERVPAVMAMMAADRSVRDGDCIRAADTLEEWERRGGIWEKTGALTGSVRQVNDNLPREKIICITATIRSVRSGPATPPGQCGW